MADGAGDSAYGIGTYALALFGPMHTYSRFICRHILVQVLRPNSLS